MISDTFGAFSLPYKLSGREGLAIVIPEMWPARVGITPSGKYHINCLDMERGTLTFIIEQNDSGKWFAEIQPPFITFEL